MKKTVALILSILLLVGATGCGSKPTDDKGGKKDAGGDTGKTYTIKAAHQAAEDNPWQASMLEFETLVEASSKGKVQVDVYFGGTLGYDRDLIEGMQGGTVDVAYVTTAPISGFVPEIGVLDLPYVFSGWDHAFAFVESDVAKTLGGLVEEKGLINLGFFPEGFRQATNSKRAITSLADVKGLKIRVMQSDVFIDTFQALGASPVPMAWAEVPTSLQQGTIDGQENGILTNFSNKVWEYQKYMSLTSHCAYMTTMLGSQVLLNKLPDEYKAIIETSSKEASKNGMLRIKEAEEATMKEIEAKGMLVNEVDITEFAKATESVRTKFTDKFGADILTAIMELKK